MEKRENVGAFLIHAGVTKTWSSCYFCAADKKIPGAEKKSKYYQKYGNPNYGGSIAFSLCNLCKSSIMVCFNFLH